MWLAQFHTDDIKQQYIWFLAMVSNSLEQLKRLSAKTKMLQYSMQESCRISAWI